MLKIAWKRFISSLHIHIFVVVQLSIVLSICLMMVSSVYSRFEYYLPLQDLMNRNASAVQFNSEYQLPGSVNPLSKSRIVFRDIDILSQSFPDKAHTWYARYSPLITPVEKNNKNNIFISYTENTWSLYEPKMTEGNWSAILSSGLTENGNIPVIVYLHNMDYKIGDILEVTKVNTYETDSEDTALSTVRLEICGFLDGGAMLFGGSIGDGLHNHTSFYKPAEDYFDNSDPDAEGALFVMSQDLIDSIGVAAVVSQCNGIITYDNNISQEQVVINTERLHSMIGLPAENIASIKDFSLLYIMQQVYALLPLFVCIAILALISSICTSAVITKKNIHTYAIFHLCGATSGKCVLICIFQTLFVSFSSLLLTGCMIVVISKTMQISVIINQYSVLLCTIVLVLHLLLTSMLPMHMLREDSLKNLLQRER